MKLLSRAERKAMRAALREQQRALRSSLAVRIAEQRRQPLFVEAEARRRKQRQRRLLAILIVLLLLLLLRFDCAEGPQAPAAPAVVEAEPPEPPKKAKKAPKKRKVKLEGKVEPSDRGKMATEPAPPPAWLSQFRLQVAARSTRLAACFNGAEKPGALRWSALVHAQSGRVTESAVEPVFRGVSLDEKQEVCLIGVLTDPAYKLDEPDPEAAARRVSLIFEF